MVIYCTPTWLSSPMSLYTNMMIRFSPIDSTLQTAYCIMDKSDNTWSHLQVISPISDSDVFSLILDYSDFTAWYPDNTHLAMVWLFTRCNRERHRDCKQSNSHTILMNDCEILNICECLLMESIAVCMVINHRRWTTKFLHGAKRMWSWNRE